MPIVHPSAILILEISSLGVLRLDGEVVEAIELVTKLRATRALEPALGVIIRTHEDGKSAHLLRAMKMLRESRVPTVAVLSTADELQFPTPPPGP